jgi:hypothetical protein
VTQTIWCSDKFRHDWKHFIEFVQHQANRLAFGYPRYEAPHGGPSKENRYMTRLGLELKAYRRTGNREYLVNIANYAWLESQAPENRKFHWDNTVDSTTRGRAKGI